MTSSRYLSLYLTVFVWFLPEKSSSRQSAFQWVRIVPLFSPTFFCIDTKRNSFSLCSQRERNNFKGPLPEMRIWTILLITSDLKWCIHLSISLFLYLSISVKSHLQVHWRCIIHKQPRIRKLSVKNVSCWTWDQGPQNHYCFIPIFTTVD